MAPESPPAPRLFDGPDDGPATLLLAHGAGAPIDSPFMVSIASGLGLKGWRVVRFECGYMARMRKTGRRQGPDRVPVLQEAFRQQVELETETEAWSDRPLFVGGKSMGGRVTSLLVDGLAASSGVEGCLCLGNPLHPPGKPLTLRTEHLAELQAPTLILQVEWIPSGDHSFKPTKGSGLSETENCATEESLVDSFLGEVRST